MLVSSFHLDDRVLLYPLLEARFPRHLITGTPRNHYKVAVAVLTGAPDRKGKVTVGTSTRDGQYDLQRNMGAPNQRSTPATLCIRCKNE